MANVEQQTYKNAQFCEIGWMSLTHAHSNHVLVGTHLHRIFTFCKVLQHLITIGLRQIGDHDAHQTLLQFALAVEKQRNPGGVGRMEVIGRRL